MHTYHQKKLCFGINIFIIGLLLFLAFILLYNCLSYPLTAYGYTALMLGFAIYAGMCMYKDYKSPVILTEDAITITVRGQTNMIAYKNIMYVHYKGIPHCFLGDYMVLDCGMSGKIYVASSYENYLTLWKQITENAKATNPRVTISSTIQKRLDKLKHSD